MPSGVFVDVMIATADDVVAPVDPADDGKVLARNSSTGKYEHVVMSGGGGTSNHAELSNLDYANAGHTGFAGIDVKNSFTQGQAFLVLYRLGGDIGDGGNMESGDPPGGFDYDPSVTASASTDAYSGSQSLRMELSEANKGATQGEGAIPGTIYRCQVFAKAISGAARFRAYESADPFTEVGSAETTLTNIWESLVFDFTASASGYNLEMSGVGATDIVLFDDMTMKQLLAVMDHKYLDNLDYANSNHTGFAGTDTENVFSVKQTFSSDVDFSGLPTSPGATGTLWVDEANGGVVKRA